MSLALRFARLSLLILPASLTVLSMTTSASAADDPGKSSSSGPAGVEVQRGRFALTAKQDGLLVPDDYTCFVIAPRTFSAQLRILEVAPHGSTVRAGDTVLRLDDEGMRDAILSASWAHRSAEEQLDAARVALEDHERQGEQNVGWAEKELEFAEKALHGYLEVGLALDREDQKLSEMTYVHRIEDQEDELEQLGKMYKEDELTEETEEIVLKRARRDLEMTRRRYEVYRRRREYNEQQTRESQRQQLQVALELKRRALEKARRQRELQTSQLHVGIKKAEHALEAAQRRLKRLKDELQRFFVVKSPHDGIVLHGNFEESTTVNLLRQNSSVMPGRAAITVAKPGRLKVQFSFDAKHRNYLRAGLPVTLLPTSLPEVQLVGSLEPLSTLPESDGSWKAKVMFGSDDERLRPLLRCAAEMRLVELDEAVLIPLAALFRRDGHWVCYVQDPDHPDKVRMRRVRRGPADDKMCVIHEGLEAGEKVLREEPRS